MSVREQQDKAAPETTEPKADPRRPYEAPRMTLRRSLRTAVLISSGPTGSSPPTE